MSTRRQPVAASAPGALPPRPQGSPLYSWHNYETPRAMQEASVGQCTQLWAEKKAGEAGTNASMSQVWAQSWRRQGPSAFMM